MTSLDVWFTKATSGGRVYVGRLRGGTKGHFWRPGAAESLCGAPLVDERGKRPRDLKTMPASICNACQAEASRERLGVIFRA